MDNGGRDGQQGVGKLAALVQVEKAPGQWSGGSVIIGSATIGISHQ